MSAVHSPWLLGRVKRAPRDGGGLLNNPKLRALVFRDSVREARAAVPGPAASDARCLGCKSPGLPTVCAGARDCGLFNHPAAESGRRDRNVIETVLHFHVKFLSWSVDWYTKDADLAGNRL